MFLLILQVLTFFLGIAAYYCAIFMYEDEQGALQNRVEELWAAINDRKKKAGGRIPALLNKVASLVKRTFDRVFGPKLFSVQLIGVSVCYALAGLCLGVAGIFAWLRARLLELPQLPSNLHPEIIPSLSLVAKYLWVIGAILFVLGILPAIKRSAFTIFLSLIPCLIIVPAAAKAVLNHEKTGDSLGLLLGLFLSFLCDVGMLLAVRVSLKVLVRENRIHRILLAIAVQVMVIALLILLPFETGGWLMTKYGRTPLLTGFGILTIFNLFTALAAALFLLTLLFVLLHRLFWPLLDRVLYPVAARRVIADSKVMTTFGTACMAVASPMVWRVLKALAWAFGKLGS